MTSRGLAVAMTLTLAASIALWHRDANAPQPARKPVAFYIWQYAWSPAVADAARQAGSLHPGALYVMAGELGGPAQPDPDWGALAGRAPKIVPVLRIFAGRSEQLTLAPDRLAQEVADRIAQLRSEAAARGVAFRSVQLDLDCPERLLKPYGRFLRHLRPLLGGLRLEITALPCHLANPSFRAVAEEVDSFTLQVHGLDFPKRWGEPCALVDERTAMRAIRRASACGQPFRLALPTYAFRLVFDRASGRFIGLQQAASPAPDPLRHRVVTVAPDPEMVRRLAARANETAACEGVIWFRMPVPGDAAGWDLETIAALGSNEPLPPSIEALTRTDRTGETILELVNHRELSARSVTLALTWPDARGEAGVIAPETSLAVTSANCLPATMTAPLPPPGIHQPLAWFHASVPASRIELRVSPDNPAP